MEPVALWGTRKVCLLSWSCYTYLIQVNILSMQTIKNIFINKHTRGSARRGRPFKDVGGFTIIELLVVIVIIAILAIITIVAYASVIQKAVASSLQSDLSNAATALKVFEVDNGSYPSTISTDCSATPDSPTNKCLKLTPGNIYIGYSANNTSSSKSFLLIASNKATTGSGSIAYKVTNSTAPTQLATTSQPNTTPGAVLELHAAKANGGTGPGINSPLTTTWKDTSGNNNNGTLTGFGGQTPWGGDRLTMLGNPSYVALPDLGVAEGKVFAYEVWAARPTDTVTYIHGLLCESAANYKASARLFINPFTGFGAQFSLVDDAYNKKNVYGTGVIDGNVLHHIVATADGTFMRLYIDGSLNVAAVDYSSLGSLTLTEGWIGKVSVDYPSYSDASIYVARIYPFALNAAQIQQNYNAGTGW